ncbi:hypothetical protein [Natrarchaeobius oligotrophus]|uniref:Uncharacterized protein n=1 Tax=Natrarchaeobius chitinivorans TaxID=1679083 RepID=A0A3N6MHB7_NATCH|nr:hypothetical protein [Natrarchaeobius chitinivorans]RQH00465.1 hypothetical protein EA472_11535 [Natrarchaeobius chitinivorans]
MIRGLFARLREWIAVDDPEDRIEGSGEPIVSPQNRRSAEAERLLRESRDALEDDTDPRYDE